MKTLITAAMAAALAVPAAGAGGEAATAGGEAAWTAAQSAAAPNAPASAGPGGAVVRDRTVEVSVDLNSKTVKCSAADYSQPMLKVLIPDLAALTVLNHRNTREGAPCVAAGRCAEIGPEAILKSGEGADRIPVRVVLEKILSLNGGVCHVALQETVTTTIRGVPFFHQRRQAVGERAAADCR